MREGEARPPRRHHTCSLSKQQPLAPSALPFQGAAAALASAAALAAICSAAAACALAVSVAAHAPDWAAAALKESGISWSAAEPAASTERWANEVTDPKAAEAASGAEMVDPVAGLDRDRALEAAARTWAVVGGGRGVGVGERRR